MLERLCCFSSVLLCAKCITKVNEACRNRVPAQQLSTLSMARSSQQDAVRESGVHLSSSKLATKCVVQKRKENFVLFSDHNRSLLKRQPNVWCNMERENACVVLSTSY